MLSEGQSVVKNANSSEEVVCVDVVLDVLDRIDG